MQGVEPAMLCALSHILEDEVLTDQQGQQALLPHQHGGMCLRHRMVDSANMARLSSTAPAECAMVNGVESGLFFHGDVTMELKATLAGICRANPDANAKCFLSIPMELLAHVWGRAGSGSWRGRSREPHTNRPTPAIAALFAALLAASHS